MNTVKILSSVTEEERLLIRHIIDLAKRSLTGGRAMSSAFLDERQLLITCAALESEGYTEYSTFGGYEGAVRRVIRFNGYGEDAPLSVVIFSYREVDKPTHRDFLGALMSLNIKREMIGDILVSDKRTAVFVMNQVKPLVAGITKIGRAGVKVSFDFSENDIPEQQFDTITATVQSLRLDSCLSSAIRLSRGKTQELIKTKGVALNHTDVYDPSVKISEGDVFSVRGMGKYVLREIGGMSKKDRIFITIDKFK